MPRTRDTRITGYEPLLSPAALLDEMPLTDEAAAHGGAHPHRGPRRARLLR